MSFTDSLKSLIPAPARRQIKQLLGIQPELDPDWRILAPAGPVKTPHVVFDVGAYKGYFIHSWRKWCPLAEVHAFDASLEAYTQLKEKYSGQSWLHLNNVGVGETPGTLELNIATSARSCNSFLAPKRETWQEVQYVSGEMQKRSVPVITLDNYVKEKQIPAIHLIKIDVQGFEMNVLKGASQVTLPRTGYVFVESGIRPFYEGAPRFSDVFNYMTGQGFHLIGMRSWHRGNHTLMEADLLFRRDDLMPPINPPPGVDKIVEHTA